MGSVLWLWEAFLFQTVTALIHSLYPSFVNKLPPECRAILPHWRRPDQSGRCTVLWLLGSSLWWPPGHTESAWVSTGDQRTLSPGTCPPALKVGADHSCVVWVLVVMSHLKQDRRCKLTRELPVTWTSLENSHQEGHIRSWNWKRGWVLYWHGWSHSPWASSWEVKRSAPFPTPFETWSFVSLNLH